MFNKAVVFYILFGVIILCGGFMDTYAAEEESAAAQSEETAEAGPPSALDELSEEPPMWQVPGTTGSFWRIRYLKVLMSWVVIVVLIAFAYAASRKFTNPPARLQCLAEMILSFFDGLTHDTLGDKSRKLFPLITTLFLFILLCNWIGMIPGIGQFVGFVIGLVVAPLDSQVGIIGGFLKWSIEIPDGHWLAIFQKIPAFSEPTADLNTTLGCGAIVIVVVHTWAIRAKGLAKYLKGYAHPIIFFAPLNIVGELAKGISLSFRLFGNILGGGIVILVLSTLMLNSPILFMFGIALRVPLILFLGLFIGAIQAFVFSMLALTYTAVAIGED